MFVVAAIFALNIWMLGTTELPASSPRVWLGTGIIWVCSVPVVLFAARPTRWYPLLPLISLAYLASYGVPSFQNRFPQIPGHDPISELHVRRACEIALLGVAMLVLGMAIPVHRLFSTTTLRWPSDERIVASRFAFASAVGGALHVLTFANLVPESVAQPVLVVAVMTEIGGVVVLGLWLRRQASVVCCLVALASLMPLLALAFGTGLLWNVIRPILIFAVGYFGLRRRIPWTMLAVLTAIAIPAHQVKMEFRYELQQHEVDLFERPVLFAELIGRAYSGETPSIEETSGNAAERLGHVAELAHVVALTPGRVPFWDGKTYATLPYAPIPRFIMPDKPTKELGQAFGHRYELIDPGNFDTSVNLAQLVEAYVNFGVPGVLVGMFIIGVLAAIVSALFEHPKPSLAAIAVGSGLAVQLFNIESDFGLVYGGLLIELPAIWLIMQALTWRVGPQTCYLSAAPTSPGAVQ
jgi:hypothetical protein